MSTETKLSWEQVKAEIPESITLIFVDYRESFDGHEKLLQKFISGDTDELYEEIDGWYDEAIRHNVANVTEEMSSAIQEKYNLEEEEAEEIIEEYRESIEEIIHDRDDSTVFEDLARNTTGLVAHYDTGYEMESDSWNWSNQRVNQEIFDIKKFLGILDTQDYDDALDMMIRQASYGGSLLIFFNLDLDDFKNVTDHRNTVTFNDAQIGIIDHCNGSGDTLGRSISAPIKLPYNPKNVFLEKSIKYNWTYSIAGMCSDWADSTSLEFSEEKTGEVKSSKINEHLEREELLNKTYKEGKCTFGDMDIKRHRNVEYVNNYPCGNLCHDCKTFWID
jgi:hypothetical protein